MAGRNCIASFIQLSDIHIGTPSLPTGDAEARKFWAYAKVFRGLIGHEYRALYQIRRYLQRPPENFKGLFVTGDLTRVGHEKEFALATGYLNAQATFGSQVVGLRQAGTRERTIPGNHDHWPGRSTVFGRPTSGLGTLMTCPYVRTLALAEGFTLRVLAINTDDQVSPYGWNRFMARGIFRRQLDELAGHLGPVEDKEVRVLLMHHSPANRDHVLGIENASNQALADFVEDQHVAVILTGHMHAPRIRVDTFEHTRTVEALEARCGSSTVRRTLPLGWKAFGDRPNWRPHDNALLEHRLLLAGDRLVWKAETILQRPNGFYRPKPQIYQGEAEFRVWPLAR